MHVLWDIKSTQYNRGLGCFVGCVFLLLCRCHVLCQKHNLYPHNLCPGFEMIREDWGQITIRIIKCVAAVNPDPFSFLYTNQLSRPEITCGQRPRQANWFNDEPQTCLPVDWGALPGSSGKFSFSRLPCGCVVNMGKSQEFFLKCGGCLVEPNLFWLCIQKSLVLKYIN